MEISATRGTVKGHRLAVGDVVNFHGMVNDGFPNTEAGTLVKVGKEGAKYTLTSVDEVHPSTGKPWVWTFGASAQFWATPVESVTVTEHEQSDGVTLYSGKCVHGWQTGFYADRDDAIAVAAGHGQVSIPTYDQTRDASAEVARIAEAMAPLAPLVPLVPIIPTAADHVEMLASAHWANATSDDPEVSTDRPMSAYRASKEALFQGIATAYPDVPVRQVYDLWAEHGESVRQVVAFIRDTRHDALTQVSAYLSVTLQGADVGTLMEARVDARSAVYNALGYAGTWDAASNALSGMVCALYPVPDPDAAMAALAEHARRAWDVYTAPQDTVSGMPVADWACEGDSVYRDRDGAQGVISQRIGDMVNVVLHNGTQFTCTLVALAAMDYEAIPAADMAAHMILFATGAMEVPGAPENSKPDMAPHLTPKCTCNHTPKRWVPRSHMIKIPTRTKINKRKRNAARKGR